MKTIIAILMFTMTLIISKVHAEGLSSVSDVEKLGMQVKMGELTGAGSKFSVRSLEGLLLPDGVLMKEDCSAIIVKTNDNPKISDIIKIRIHDQEIPASEFIGFVIR